MYYCKVGFVFMKLKKLPRYHSLSNICPYTDKEMKALTNYAFQRDNGSVENAKQIGNDSLLRVE